MTLSRNELALNNAIAQIAEIEATLNALHNRLYRQHVEVLEATTPSTIIDGFEKLEKDWLPLSKQLERYRGLAALAADANYTLNREQYDEQKTQLGERLDSTKTQVNVGKGLAAGGVVAGILSGGIGWIVSGVGALNAASAIEQLEKLEAIGTELDRLWAEVESEIEGQKHSTNALETRHSFFPNISTMHASYAYRVFGALKDNCESHQVEPDSVARKVLAANAEVGESFLNLLRTNYDQADLDRLIAFARTADLSDSDEMRAFVQFINHTVVPHRDYFDIWASKVKDFNTLIGDVYTALDNLKPEARPALEILGEKPISLSGKRDLQAVPAKKIATTPGELRALAAGNERHGQAVQLVTGLVADVYDTSKGTIRHRHDAVEERAEIALKEFNGFFAGIDRALRDVQVQLDKAIGDKDKTLLLWERAEGSSMQLKLLALEHPDEIARERRIGDALGALGSEVASGGSGNGVANYISGIYRRWAGHRRSSLQYAVKMESHERRTSANKLDLIALDAKLDELDKQVEMLIENRDFQAYIANSGQVLGTRATLMILPRLIAGENNIDAMEARAHKAGYAQIDDFIEEVRDSNPRLAEALENHLFGLANSNDLRVMVAEANVIQTPKNKAQALLVDYVEKVIKRHYTDQSRQASIMDTLAMRNVIPTRQPFHSFGEIVKQETDSALQALLGGRGDFTLVGSNDVRDIFAYYLARHSNGSAFVDPRNPSRMVGKFAAVEYADQLSMVRDQAVRMRGTDSPIPRVSTIFTEICAHEYLLSQGLNAVKNAGLAYVPQALGATEMVNEVTRDFIQKLAIYEARAKGNRTDASGKVVNDQPLGMLVENLIAATFVEFFAEVGTHHIQDIKIKGYSRKVGTAYSGENYSLANETYTDVITADAKGKFDLFLRIYQENLEKTLEDSTRETRQELLQQLAAVKDIMPHIQVTDNTVMPDTEAARLRAHYRNHSFSNLGLNPDTWAARAAAIAGDGKYR